MTSPSNRGRYPEEEEFIETWESEYAENMWSMYDHMVGLRLIPTRWRPTSPDVRPRKYVYWKAHSNRPGSPLIYLGPSSVDFNLQNFSNLLGQMPGAELSPRTNRPRDIKFWFRNAQELEQTREAARLAAAFLGA